MPLARPFICILLEVYKQMTLTPETCLWFAYISGGIGVAALTALCVNIVRHHYQLIAFDNEMDPKIPDCCPDCHSPLVREDLDEDNGEIISCTKCSWWDVV